MLLHDITVHCKTIIIGSDQQSDCKVGKN